MDLGTVEISLSARLDELERKLSQGERSVQSSASRMARNAAIAAGAAVAAGAVAGAAAFRRQLQEVDDLAKRSRSIGVPVRELSALSLSARLAGSSIAEVSTAVGRFSRQIVEAQRGQASARRLFESLGIDPASGASTTQILDQVADRFAGLSNGAERTALAMELFGRAGLSMVPLLAQGSAELQRQRQLAERLGLTFDETTSAAVEKFNDSLTILRASGEGAIRRVLVPMAPALDQVADRIVEWTEANADLMAGGLTTFLEAAFTGATKLAGGLAEVVAQAQLISKMGVREGIDAAARNAFLLQGDAARQRLAQVQREEIEQFAAYDPRARALIEAIEGPQTGPPRPRGTAAGAATAAGFDLGGFSDPNGGDGPTALDALREVAAQQEAVFRASEIRLRGEIDLLRERGDTTGQIEALEARILEQRQASLASQIALTRAAEGYTAEVAVLTAEYDVLNTRIAASTGPAMQVADEFERATVAAERLGTTLQQDVLASVREMVVGLGRGTTTLDRFGEQLVSTTTGNVIGRLFDEAIGEGGIFGPGTGAGAGAAERSFATRIASVFGAEAASNAPPEGLTGPPEPMGAMGELGQAGAVGLAAGSTAVNLARMFGVKETTGVGTGAGVGAAAGMAFGGPLGAAIGAVGGGLIGGLIEGAFRPRETGGHRGRRALNDLFRDAGLVATRALSKRNRGAIADLDAPGFFGDVESDLLALGGVLGLDYNAARQGAGSLGQRATLLGLTQEQVQAEAARAARRSGVSIEEAVGDLNVDFADFQGRGRDASMTQEEYNRRLQSTVRLLMSDLPAGVDTSVVALGSLEKFGEVSIANLDDLERALDRVAQSAGTFASAFGAGFRSAVLTGDVTDVASSLADAFVSTLIDQVQADMLDSGVLSEDLTRAVALQRDISAAYAAGDFALAGALQAQLSDTFAQASATIQQQSAPIVASLSGFQASMGIQQQRGVIQQQPIVIQNIVDGRVVSESVHNAERLGRSPGAMQPIQVGTR